MCGHFHVDRAAFHQLYGLPEQAARNIDLVLHTTVRSIDLSDDGTTASRVNVVCPNGNAFSYRPRVVVVAAGGIDNARVLRAIDTLRRPVSGSLATMTPAVM